MNVQLGHIYKNRMGRTLHCIAQVCSQGVPVGYELKYSKEHFGYNVGVDGSFISPEVQSKYDLIEEEVMITEEQFMQWAKGKEFVTTDGQIVQLAEVYKGLDFDWTCLPKWANYITQQDDGNWKWFADKPTISEDYDGWVTYNVDPSSHGYIPTSQFPSNIYGGWQNNCHKRP